MIGILLRVEDEQLKKFIEDSSLLEEYVDSDTMEESESKLDIHKSWDGINYLLSNVDKTNSVLSKLIFSGQILDENQDMGYGPAQYLTSNQVEEAGKALSMASEADLRKFFDSAEMNKAGVYPEPWQNNDDEIDWLIQYYNRIKEFYIQAANQKQAIIVYIE